METTFSYVTFKYQVKLSLVSKDLVNQNFTKIKKRFQLSVEEKFEESRSNYTVFGMYFPCAGVYTKQNYVKLSAHYVVTLKAVLKGWDKYFNEK